MKKKELILDFTSLLDVILILLFIVTTGMSQASASANDEINSRLTEAQAQIQELNTEREQLLLQLETLRGNEEDYAAAVLELQQLEQSYAALQDEYDHLKITTNYDEDDLSVYEAAIEKITHLVIMCDTSLNAETGNQEVKMDIYLDTDGGAQQSYANSVVIVHDFGLTKQERARLSADQTVEMTKALSEALRNDQSKMVWVSVQYSYADKNFANSDLEIINKALDNLEHSFDISCYAEEMKIY